MRTERLDNLETIIKDPNHKLRNPTPTSSPTVLDEPVFFARVLVGTETDQQNAVIQVGLAALWLIVDTAMVQLLFRRMHSVS